MMYDPWCYFDFGQEYHNIKVTYNTPKFSISFLNYSDTFGHGQQQRTIDNAF